MMKRYEFVLGREGRKENNLEDDLESIGKRNYIIMYSIIVLSWLYKQLSSHNIVYRLLLVSKALT